MQFGFEVVAAKSKKAESDEAPAQVSMSRQPQGGIRRNPTGDQKKVRHQQTRNASGQRVASTIILPVRTLNEACSACGAAVGEPCHDSLGPVAWTHTKPKTASPTKADPSGTGQPERMTCSNCGSGEAYASTGLCPQCGHMNKTATWGDDGSPSCSNCEHTKDEHGGDGPCEACLDQENADKCGGFEEAGKQAAFRARVQAALHRKVGAKATCKDCGAALKWDGQQYLDEKGDVSCPKGGAHRSSEEFKDASKQSARSDYDHWNEDADYVWYQEEGRHPEEPPDPDDFDIDDRDYEDEDEDDGINAVTGDPRIPEHQLGASRKERKTMTTPIHREAELLRALAVATPEEQTRILADLEALRDRKIASVQTAAELDMDDTVIAAYLTPVSTHSYHTAATDWIDEVGVEEPEFDANALLTEATLWFRRTSADVRGDRDEFAAQAQGYAVRTASQFGVRAPEAARMFLDHVAHLHRTAGTETGDNANAVSGLPDEVPLEGHEQVLDNFAPPVAPVNADVTPEDTSSNRAQNVGVRSTPEQRRAALQRQAEGGATCSSCGAAIERDPEGEEPRTWHHNDGAKHDHEATPSGGDKESARVQAGGLENFGDEKAKPFKDDDEDDEDKKEARRIAASYGDDPFLFEADVIADPSGQANSGLPAVEVGDKDDRPMWPWELAEDEKKGEDAADVASVPTPGQSEADYPQPKGAAKVAAENCGSCGHSVDSHNQGPNADECGCGCSYFHKSSARRTAGETATCAHCDKQIEDDDGTWYHVDSMQTRCDGADDEDGIGWGDLIRQAEPKTGSRHQAGSDDLDHGESDEGDAKGYWGDEPDFDSFEDDADHEGGGWVEGPVTAPMIGSAASVNRPVPLTPTQAAFRARVQAAAQRIQS